MGAHHNQCVGRIQEYPDRMLALTRAVVSMSCETVHDVPSYA